MGWPEPAVEQLKKLWAAKKSITEIAVLTGRTRSQVGGKLFRLGLTDDDRNINNRAVKKRAQERADQVRHQQCLRTRDRRSVQP